MALYIGSCMRRYSPWHPGMYEHAFLHVRSRETPSSAMNNNGTRLITVIHTYQYIIGRFFFFITFHCLSMQHPPNFFWLHHHLVSLIQQLRFLVFILQSPLRALASGPASRRHCRVASRRRCLHRLPASAPCAAAAGAFGHTPTTTPCAAAGQEDKLNFKMLK